MKRSDIIAIALFGLLVLIRSGGLELSLPDLAFPSVASVDLEIPEPSAANKRRVAEVQSVAAKASGDARNGLAMLYLAMADTLSRYDGSLTTDRVRAWLIASDTYRIGGTDLVGAVPGFGAAKDAAVMDLLGDESREISDSERQELVDLLHAIAWALGG